MGDTVQRAVFTTRDPAQALAKLDEVYALRDVQWITGGDLSMSLTSTGAGPVNYGRLRLAAAHRDLVRGAPADGETVRAIALRWGFPHAGDFARRHRHAYGENPGHTLRG